MPKRMLAKMLCRFGIATYLGAIHAACGVYMGDPIRLFPERAEADGGALPRDLCLLNRTEVSGEDETLASGATGAQLTQLAESTFSNRLSWLDGRTTTLRVELSNVVVHSVEAQRNASFSRFGEAPVCVDHATIEASLGLYSDDGRLAESLERISLVAYDDYEAHGTFEIPRDALVGTYAGSARSDQCFETLKVRLMIARDGSHGSLADEIRARACDDTREASRSELAAAHWGARWTNYGD